MENIADITYKRNPYKKLIIVGVIQVLLTAITVLIYVRFCHIKNGKSNLVLLVILSVISVLLAVIPITKEKSVVKQILFSILMATTPEAICIEFYENKSIFLLIAVIVDFIILFWMYRNAEIKKKRNSNIIRAFLKAYKTTATIVCIIGLVFAVTDVSHYIKHKNDNDSLSVYILNQLVTQEPDVKPTNNASTKEDSYIKACISELSPIVDGTWDKTKAKDKLDIYQRIVNIEASYNGFSKSIKVCYANIDTSHNDDSVLYAQYSDSTATIYLNQEKTNELPAKESLMILLHEVYHVYQHQLIDVYNSVDENYKRLNLLYEASIYAEENENYKNGEEDYDAYRKQKLEIMADNYGYKTAIEYIELIEKYLQEENQR